MPIFAVYVLFFADHGLSTTQITVLLASWSLTSFAFEIPSGAWADMVDRRLLLIGSAVIYVLAFACWLVWPTFWGSLLGFVVWSLSGAMHSGTFEAYLFDQLAARQRPARYGVLKARAESVALIAMAVAIAAAAPLHTTGGYELVGWVSVSVAAVHVLVAVLLPHPAPATPSAAALLHLVTDLPEDVRDELPEAEPPSVGAWLHTVRAGLAEARASLPVRRVLLAYAAVVALVGFDEYFPLVLTEGGVAVDRVALILAGIVLLEATGTWLADRVAHLTGGSHAALVVAGGTGLAAGAALSGWPSAIALGLGYAVTSSAYVAGDIRLQHSMSGTARATVTSIAGVVAELGFLVTLALVGLATLRWDLSPVVAVLALVLTVPAAVTAYRAPGARRG